MFLKISENDKAFVRLQLDGVDEKAYQFKVKPMFPCCPSFIYSIH